MIGQQKRSLEHSVSPQPTKYQKHCYDNSCETSTRIASLTGEQLDFEDLFSGVQSKYALSSPPAIGFDSRTGEKAVTLDLSDQPRKQNVLSEADQGAKCNSCHKLDSLSHPTEGLEARESTDYTYSQICSDAKVEDRKLSRTFLADLSNHAEDRVLSMDLFPADNLEHARLHLAEDFSSSREKRTEREMLLEDAFKESSSQSGGNECGGSCQKDKGPSTTNVNEMGGEGDLAFLECVRKTVDSRRPNGSRPLPVFLSGKVVNLYLMNEQVKAHGGYQSVTSEGLWGRISQTLGFVPECGPGVKLVYFKYLKALERETSQSLEAQPDPTSLDVAQARIGDFAIDSRLDDEKGEKFIPLVREQFAESEPFLEKAERTTMNVDYQKKGVDHHLSDHFEYQTGKQITGKDRETGRPRSYHRDGGGQGSQRIQSGLPQVGNCISRVGWEETQAQSTDRQLPKTHVDISGPRILKREFEKEDGRNSEESARTVSKLLGRNHQPLTSTLIWIKRMALDPGNPHMGEGVEGAGQNEEWVKDCASQAENIRGFFWQRKEEIRVGEAHLHQVNRLDQLSTKSPSLADRACIKEPLARRSVASSQHLESLRNPRAWRSMDGTAGPQR